MQCPICNHENAGMICQNCGYDGSMDLTRYPTVCALPPQSIRMFQRKRHQPDHFFLATPRKPGGPTIAAGGYHTVAVRNDGKVMVAGSRLFDCCRLSKWNNIVSVAAGFAHTVGLRCDGTVVARGSNGYGECNVSHWTNIVAIAAGEYHTVGLKSDGTVVATGINDGNICDVSDWDHIVAIAASSGHTVGLRADGTVVEKHRSSRVRKTVNTPTGYQLADVEDDVSGWRDIISISANWRSILGIHRDGTVISNYEDIRSVSHDSIRAIAGGRHTIFLRKNGTVFAQGDNRQGECNVSHWKDIVAVDVGDVHSVGLRKDGTVVTAGSRQDGRRRVFHWKNIMIPAF